MTRFYFPAPGLAPWQAVLADPVKHWKDGKSAKELARSWVAAEKTPRGLPPKVAAILDTDPDLAGATLLLGIPEHKVDLPSPGRPSQNDLWAILRAPSGLVSMTVEGKSGEPFDRTVGDWMKDASPGRVERLRGLCELLDAPEEPPASLRYQLFHRTASAIIEAQRWGISRAVMLVHSFGGKADEVGRRDFDAFGDWIGLSSGSVRSCTLHSSTTLHLAWVADTPKRSDEESALLHLLHQHSYYAGLDISLPYSEYANTTPRPILPVADIDRLLTHLIRDWNVIAGPVIAPLTRPLAFAGRKARRLLVEADFSAVPPWGSWQSLRPPVIVGFEALDHPNQPRYDRGSFTALRRAINLALSPHGIDHVDFVPRD